MLALVPKEIVDAAAAADQAMRIPVDFVKERPDLYQELFGTIRSARKENLTQTDFYLQQKLTVS